MDKEIVVRLHSSFEDMVRKHPETGMEFWCARDLQLLLGYAQWKNFAKFKAACQGFFEGIDEHATALRSLLTENFQVITA